MRAAGVFSIQFLLPASVEGESPETLRLMPQIDRIDTKWLLYGLPRITVELRQHGWEVNAKRVARLRREHAEQILTYFPHRFNNAIAEWVNRRIQALTPKACGYRNRKRFKTDVLFHLGGLDLYPMHVL